MRKWRRFDGISVLASLFLPGLQFVATEILRVTFHSLLLTSQPCMSALLPSERAEEARRRHLRFTAVIFKQSQLNMTCGTAASSLTWSSSLFCDLSVELCMTTCVFTHIKVPYQNQTIIIFISF